MVGMSIMPEFTATASNQNIVAEDILLPFEIISARFKGKAVRLQSIGDTILARHQYPPAIAKLLLEMLLVNALFGANIEKDQILTLQVRGKGDLSLLLSDMNGQGDMRAYARYQAGEQTIDQAVAGIWQSGYVTFSVSKQKGEMLMQSHIPLTHHSIAKSVSDYFEKMESIDIALAMAIEPPDKKAGKGYRAGAVMIQRLAGDLMNDVDRNENESKRWDTAKILLASATEKELRTPTLSLHDLLFRLFHEEGVRAFAPKKLHDKCHCSSERFANYLKQMDQTALTELQEEGEIKVQCDFCGRNYPFRLDQLFS